jgi:hypothetical protein
MADNVAMIHPFEKPLPPLQLVNGTLDAPSKASFLAPYD